MLSRWSLSAAIQLHNNLSFASGNNPSFAADYTGLRLSGDWRVQITPNGREHLQDQSYAREAYH